MEFRRALERDAKALFEIAFRAKAHWPYSPAQLASWSEDLAVSPGAISALPTYVVEIEREIVGFFALVPTPEIWRLEHFWVSPASTGRGIGRALLEHAVSVATQQGATALEIDADPNAEQFYIACGAVRVGTVAAPIEGQPYRERPQVLLSIEQLKPSFRRTGLLPAA